MASTTTHQGYTRSLFKRGLLTQKQHDRMMAKLHAMAPQPLPASGEGDAAMTSAATPAAGAAVPVTASVPGAPSAEGDVTKPVKPPGM